MGANSTKGQDVLKEEKEFSEDYSTYNEVSVQSVGNATCNSFVSEDGASEVADDSRTRRNKKSRDTSKNNNVVEDIKPMRLSPKLAGKLPPARDISNLSESEDRRGDRLSRLKVSGSIPITRQFIAPEASEWDSDNVDEQRSKKGAKRAREVKPKPDVKSKQSAFESDTELLNDVTRSTDFLNDSENSKKYPESYADRIRNQQYKRQPSDLLREKTIFRDPAEWSYAYENKHVFDKDKTNATDTRDKEQLSYKTLPDQTPVTQLPTQPSDPARLPHYDISEERLMAEIEGQFL